MTNSLLRPRLLSLAPLVVLAHVVEEALGLSGWLKRHFELNLTMDYFIVVNAIGLLIMVALAVLRIGVQDHFRALGLIAWRSFLMPANGVGDLAASARITMACTMIGAADETRKHGGSWC